MHGTYIKIKSIIAGSYFLTMEREWVQQPSSSVYTSVSFLQGKNCWGVQLATCFHRVTRVKVSRHA